MAKAKYNGRLKAAISDKGISQETCASKVGITGSLLSQILYGRALPTAETRERLAKLLGKTEKELFGG